MVIKKCKKWWQYVGLTEKTEKSNRTESIRFVSVTKSSRFGSIYQKLVRTEPNRPMLTPNSSLSAFEPAVPNTSRLEADRFIIS